jgi:acetyl esterase/lipase
MWPKSTPPLFLAVAGDDPIASQAEIDAFNSLRAQGLPVELHIYEKGVMGSE